VEGEVPSRPEIIVVIILTPHEEGEKRAQFHLNKRDLRADSVDYTSSTLADASPSPLNGGGKKASLTATMSTLPEEEDAERTHSPEEIKVKAGRREQKAGLITASRGFFLSGKPPPEGEFLAQRTAFLSPLFHLSLFSAPALALGARSRSNMRLQRLRRRSSFKNQRREGISFLKFARAREREGLRVVARAYFSIQKWRQRG